MNACNFSAFLKQFALLSQRQRAHLLTLLHPVRDNAAAVIDTVTGAQPVCPHCNSAVIYRHGRANGLQRYRCRSCGKTFNGLTGTPLARLHHRDRWFDYLDCMIDAKSVRRAAATAGVHRNTSFRWRHRFLMAAQVAPSRLTGIAEADETFLRESEKGARQLDRPPRKRGGPAGKRGISSEQVCILVARDRTGQTVDFVTGKGPVTKQQLHTHLPPALDRDVLLVTDGNAAYRYFALEAGITHEAVNLRAGIRTRGAVHVQNVNAYHGRFHQWLSRFNGVATRYLRNYLTWRHVLDVDRIASPEALLTAAIGLSYTR